MKDSGLSNSKPKCTILETFDGMIMVIGPNIKSNHKEMEAAFDFIEKSHWEINISHLHGCYGKKRGGSYYHGNIKGGTWHSYEAVKDHVIEMRTKFQRPKVLQSFEMGWFHLQGRFWVRDRMT